jgi:predicted transposase/invertase (TIGR01784 family)
MDSAAGDLVFKLIFSDARSKKMLIHLLNSIIVGAKDNPIADLQIRKTELIPEYLGGKEVRLDILAEASDGRRVNVEIQRQSRSYFIKRSLFHWAEIYFQQLPKGGKFSDLCQTICINILEENIFKDDRFWHKYHLREDETFEFLTNAAEFHFVEIVKMKGYQKDNPITWWIEYIKNRATCKIYEMLEKLGVDFHLTTRRVICKLLSNNWSQSSQVKASAASPYRVLGAEAAMLGLSVGPREREPECGSVK